MLYSYISIIMNNSGVFRIMSQYSIHSITFFIPPLSFPLILQDCKDICEGYQDFLDSIPHIFEMLMDCQDANDHAQQVSGGVV